MPAQPRYGRLVEEVGVVAEETVNGRIGFLQQQREVHLRGPLLDRVLLDLQPTQVHFGFPGRNDELHRAELPWPVRFLQRKRDLEQGCTACIAFQAEAIQEKRERVILMR